MDLIEDLEQGSDKIIPSEIKEDLSVNSFKFTVANGHVVVKNKNSNFAINLQRKFCINED